MKTLITICLVALFAINAYPVHATIMASPLGTGAPPVMLPPYTMTPFGTDSQPEYAPVTSVDSPLGGTVNFDITTIHLIVGSGWNTWSHGYTGDVYWTYYASLVTLTLPSNTVAFYFYAEPVDIATYTITASINGGMLPLSQDVYGGGGACGFAFWAHGDDRISTITITCPDDTYGFAVGEFGIAAIPEPTTICLLGFGAVCLIRTKK